MPANRPHIPNELERRVLVEAGHRCAIPTCRNTPVDLAHIEPWAKVREHRFENLIALCPTCHRRFDRGEIDRISMFAYKSQLATATAQRRAQVIAAYCALRAALDAWDRSIEVLMDANVVATDPGEEQLRRAACVRERISTHLICLQFAAAATPEAASLAERLFARYTSLGDEVADGLHPSTHPGADRHEDIQVLEEELLEQVSSDIGMDSSALWRMARPSEKLGGTGKRF